MSHIINHAIDNHSIDHKVNNAVLSIINDGDGSICGLSYKQRCECAKTFDLFKIRLAVKTFSQWVVNTHNEQKLNRTQIITAASIIMKYYENHVNEG